MLSWCSVCLCAPPQRTCYIHGAQDHDPSGRLHVRGQEEEEAHPETVKRRLQKNMSHPRSSPGFTGDVWVLASTPEREQHKDTNTPSQRSAGWISAVWANKKLRGGFIRVQFVIYLAPDCSENGQKFVWGCFRCPQLFGGSHK